VNIYPLLDLYISTISSSRDIQFKKEFDPTFPDLRLDMDGFTKLLNKSFTSFQQAAKIITKLSLKMGEYIRFEKKKYPIFTMIVEKKRSYHYKHNLESITAKIDSIARFKSNEIILTSPLISA